MSCTLLDVEPGTKIKLFNSASPSQGEGYTEITVRAFVENRCVPYFTVDASDDEVEVQVHKGNGEPGRVSRIEVQSA